MATRSAAFQTIRTEGALLPPDILQRIASLKVDGARVDDFHLPPGTKVKEAITQSWTVLRAHWSAFRDARASLGEDETGTAITNDRWLLPLFKELDYGRLTTEKSPVIDDRAYPIERFYHRTPIHLVGCNLTLDRRTKGARGAATASPHSMVQEFLNRSSDHVWAFLSNGLQLRILRDNISLSRQAYVEFDLEAMMEGEVYSDFALLWLLCHQSRVEAERPEQCWLEKWSQLAREQGTRILKDLRVGVEKAIEALGQGFIAHPRNDGLREKLQSGELTKDDYYRQLLRIVYRLLFLFVAEDRDLLHPGGEPVGSSEIGSSDRMSAESLYDRYYSTRRLRDMALRIRGSKHSDLWHSLSIVFDALGRNEGCPELSLVGLGSFLWRTDSTPDLNGPAGKGIGSSEIASGENATSSTYSLLPTGYSLLSNDDLLLAIRALAYVEQDKSLRSVDYRNLGSEELGSVYESLLELHPHMHVEAKTFSLSTAAGNERKTTGSYYTPDSLVQCLLDSALEPVVEQRLAEAKGLAKELVNSQSGIGGGKGVASGQSAIGDLVLPDWFDRIPTEIRSQILSPSPSPSSTYSPAPTGYSLIAEQALLALTVCDPACGSGHFLIAAAHRLARHLARVRTGETEPSPTDYQHALRDIIGRCIYGVDINPMAVELCKVSLWMEALEPGKPLSFLDHHIQCGNSLLGTTPKLLAGGIPNDAFKPIEGDDKDVCKDLKRKNDKERSGAGHGDLQQELFEREGMPKLGNMAEVFAKLSIGDDNSVTAIREKELEYAKAIRGDKYRYSCLLADLWCAAFVWKKDESELGRMCPTQYYLKSVEKNPFSIPKVMEAEVKRLAEQYQFFHWYLTYPDVFRIGDKRDTETEHPGWTNGFNAVLGNPPWESVQNRNVNSNKKEDADRQVEAQQHFLANSAAFPYSGQGRKNLYALFVELSVNVRSSRDRAGLVVPTGLIQDKPAELLLRHLLTSRVLFSVYDFENRGFWFPDVHRQYRFCLAVFAPTGARTSFVFDCYSIGEIGLPSRTVHMSLSEIRTLCSKNIKIPMFKTAHEGLLATRCYERATMLGVLEESESVVSGLMFNFGPKEKELKIDLPSDDIVPKGYCRIYEGELMNQFTHRFATYKNGARERLNQQALAQADAIASTPDLLPTDFVEARIKQMFGSLPSGLTALRRHARSGDSFVSISAVIPRSATEASLSVFFPKSEASKSSLGLCGNFNSFIFNYLLGLRSSGPSPNKGTYGQIPVVTHNFSQLLDGPNTQVFFVIRVLELTYTAWDLEPFALDCGYDGPPFRWDEERRFLLRCELDAAYFHLYLGSVEEWGSDSEQLREMFPTPRDAVEYIMETFPIVKRKDIARTAVKNEAGEVINAGRYVTKDTILEIYDAMATSITTGHPYQTRLNPPPGPPTDAVSNFIPMEQWDKDDWPCHIHPPRNNQIDRTGR